jgi:hypothetical protein
MFSVVQLETIFNSQLLIMYMACHYTKFRIPSSSLYLAVRIKPEAKYRFDAAAVVFHPPPSPAE